MSEQAALPSFDGLDIMVDHFVDQRLPDHILRHVGLPDPDVADPAVPVEGVAPHR